MSRLYTDDDVALLQARVEAMQFILDEIRLKMEDEPFIEQPIPAGAGVWNGEIRVAGKVVTDDFLDSFTGATPTPYAKIFFDAVTPPAYASQAEYEGVEWGDDMKIVQIKELYAAFGPYNVDRA